MTISLRILAILPLGLLAACNATMLEQEAPEIAGSTWVLSAGTEAPPVDDGRWRLLAFFAPT